MAFKHTFSLSFLIYVLASCGPGTTTTTDLETIILEHFETIISIDDNLLATPTIIRLGSNSNLFVYDDAQTKVLEIDHTGRIVNEFGQAGRGPGELGIGNNFFLTDNHLYIVDSSQLLIHQYDYSGRHISSMDYGDRIGMPNTPPAPFSPSIIQAKDINNQPFVTRNGHVMLSSVNFSDSAQSIYELTEWNGNHIADLGSIPEGSTFVLDNDKLRDDVSNRVVPSFYRSNVFVVNDGTNLNGYFLVYSALPMISKYDSAGNKLWSTEIPNTQELDSLTTNFYATMERLQQADRRNRIDLKYYTSGISNSEGELFLITNTNPVWIHHFNTDGALLKRYKLVSEEIEIMPIFDIDFDRQKILVVTEEAGIRAYTF